MTASAEPGMSGEEAAALLRRMAHLAMSDPSASDMTSEQRGSERRLTADLFLICEEAERLRHQKRSRRAALGAVTADGDA
jgi:hypothetical protein